MDLKQIEYMVMIEKEQSISKAAEKLFITQSALNQQLLKLEKNLGVPLFYRTKKSCIPTESGEIYLESAKKMLNMKHETYNKINDIADIQKGKLTIGFTPDRETELFTLAYPLFHEMFPDIIVEPMELGVRKQQKLIARGDIDIGFQNLHKSQRTNDEYITLAEEEILVIVPKDHPLAVACPAHKGKSFPLVDFQLLKDDPFVLIYKESTMRGIVDEYLDNLIYTPNILFETSNINIIINLVKTGSCVSIVPYHYLHEVLDEVACFSLPNHPKLEVVASYRRGSYLSKASKTFIQLIKESNYFTDSF